MIIQCEKCQVSYQIEEDQVGQEGLAFGCSSCGHKFRVVRKTFFLVEGLEKDNSVETVVPPRAAESSAPSPEPKSESIAQEVRTPSQTPTDFKEISSPTLRSRSSVSPSIRISRRGISLPPKSTWRPYLLLLLAGVLIFFGWRQFFPETHHRTVKKIDQETKNIVQSLREESAVSPQAKQFYLQGRAEAFMDTLDAYQNAIGFYQKAIEVDENYAAVFGAYSEAAGEIASIFLLSQQREEAQPWLEEALRKGTRGLTLDPENLESLRGLAAYERLNSRFVPCQEFLDRALKIAPEDHEVFIALGRHYLTKEDLLELAEKYLNKAVVLDERSIRAQRYSAVLMERQKRLSEALGHWQKVLELNSQHSIAQVELNRIGFIQNKQKELSARTDLKNRNPGPPQEPKPVH
jgi:predicted Zn finger-like uncharacterized protein